MLTYGDMQTRIADELGRSDLTEQIKKAILSAIDFYKDDRFWFNEGEVTFNTTAGLDHQAMPTTFGEIDEATVTVSGNRYELDVVSYDIIRDRVLLTTEQGQPDRIAVFEEDIWYDPVPDQIYPIILSGLIYFTDLSALTDTNAWTNEAEQLIRHHAKADLFANVIRNDKEAGKMATLTGIFLSKLNQKTVQRTSSGKLKGTRF